MATATTKQFNSKYWMEEPIQAILEGNLEKLEKLLLDQNVDEIPCIQENFTLLHIAVGLNHVDIVKYLLKRDANPNKRSDVGITPVHLAVIYDLSETLLHLLEHGGDPLVIDKNGFNSLQIAKERNSYKCIELIQNYLKEAKSSKNCNSSHYEKFSIKQECQDVNSDTLSKKFSEICITSTTLVKSNNGSDLNRSTNNFISEKDYLTMSNNEIRQQLLKFEDNPGPVVDSTRSLYIKRLLVYKSRQANTKILDPITEISLILEDKLNLLHYICLEREINSNFSEQNSKKKWRGGNQKLSFVYFLLDPRNTKDLPSRSCELSFWETFQIFLLSIFYVGKGKQTRPFDHLKEALNFQDKKNIKLTPKIKQILDIWDSGYGVISLHCFHNIIHVEAYTREACILDALGLDNITNQRRGEYYGIAESWSMTDKKKFGYYLLYRAASIFLHEGERPLFKDDITD
ncbi:ankyrin repeat and LEM domain-containing protein 1-like isoform X1 [Centruroides sculpturatus]|uniref:ankyrin repeat and LEM domain-containing protein 1-like isoform X1 n=1 Tax=Centruroides sculpturatus TaxID=218467 RepID=UPI000C6D3BB2|nr:ankyrin repeat and LEM domain-containing protein 1-like isoform X1 [Centruroides sculpturatus]